MSEPVVSIIMGSESDLSVMQKGGDVLAEFEISFELQIVSAHRTPEYMVNFAKKAHERGIKVIIAGAGGAAHLPGMVASLTPLPVIGVPIKSTNSLGGLDSILSILQMPSGVPVATVALDNAKNAALLAIRMLGIANTSLSKKMNDFMASQRDKVLESAKKVNTQRKIGF